MTGGPDSESSSLLTAEGRAEMKAYENGKKDGEVAGRSETLIKASRKIGASALEISRLTSDPEEGDKIFEAILKLSLDIFQVNE